MTYLESPPPPGTAHAVACLWRQEVERPVQRVLPDGCLDVLRFASGRLEVAGADTGPVLVELEPGDVVTGVRLRPGAAAAVLGTDVSELRDRSVPLEDVWGAARAERALEGPLLDALHVEHAEVDALVARAGVLLGRPEARVSTVAAELGISERQLHRRVLRSIGYGPKTLARVVRLRHLERIDAADLAEAALRAGYASQAHMSDEVRRLTGLTASAYLAA